MVKPRINNASKNLLLLLSSFRLLITPILRRNCVLEVYFLMHACYLLRLDLYIYICTVISMPVIKPVNETTHLLKVIS